ncbi:MAG: LysM peptidoglycan-binding domain-containing protein [Pontiella sp.]
MRKIYIPLFVALLAITGCGKNIQSMEEREERDPFVKSGQAYMEEGKWDEAVAAFKQALENEPLMARPHLDLALIYQQHKVNYIHAIYHYDRYIELRPDAEKTQFIEEQKLKVAQALANTLINNSPEVKQVVQDRNQLIKQNAELKAQLASALNGGKTISTSTPTVTKTATETIPKSVAQAAPKSNSTPKHQIYHVVAGDNLTKIATKFYGDSADWEIILEANKDTLKAPRDLKVGQTLVIPTIQK